MAKKFRMYRRRGGPLGARFLLRLAFVVVLLAVLFGSYRNQFGELFATFDPRVPKLPAVFSLGPNSSAGPSVIKLNANPAGAPAGPKVIQLDVSSTGALGGPRLPTVIKLNTNPDRAPTGSIQPKSIEVVDGDTIRADGQPYRLAGLDTPESGLKAKCAAERELAARASRRLREIVAGGGLKLDRVACGCAAGTEGTEKCNYGRLCGVLTASGRDVSLTLIGEGLAKKYDCSAGHCPPKQPWC